MSLVPTMNLRQFRDFDGEVKLQQMMLEGGVFQVWKDVVVVDYHDADEERRRKVEEARRSGKGSGIHGR